MTAAVAPEGLELAVREMTRADRAFVASSWIRSYEHLSRIPRTVYAKHHGAVVDALLDSAVTLVAFSPSTPTLIHGFVCCSPDRGVLHYAYLQRDLRGARLGRWLVKSALGSYPERIEVTHRWPFVSSRYVFNPYVLGVVL